MKPAIKLLPAAAVLALLTACGHEGNSTSAVDQNATDQAQDAAMTSPDAAADENMSSDMNATAANAAGASDMNQADADTAGAASNSSAGAMQ